MLHKIVAAKALPNYRLWVSFQDSVEGEVDLSDLVGKGVFRSWEDPLEFAKVFVDHGTATVAWPGGLDLAPDALYRDIAGVSAR
jgi:Protein of unknown function (DUF2442)